MVYLAWQFLAAVLATIIAVITYYKSMYSYWEKKKIPCLKATIPFGHAENPFKRILPTFAGLNLLYDIFRAQGAKHCGIYSFTSPVYVPLDPEYIKNILTRDFQYFISRGMDYNTKVDPLSEHLISMEGPKWKSLRSKLTSAFTSGKMKAMFPILLKCGKQMLQAMEELGQEPVDVKEVFGSFTTDAIGSCAFGLECNSFKDGGDSEFRIFSRNVIDPNLKALLIGQFALSYPGLTRFLSMKFIPPGVDNFFMEIVKKTVDYRESNNVLGNDVMQALIQFKNVGSDEGLTFEEIAAQAFIFFMASVQTSTATLMFCLYELARNQDIQDKVRSEINRTCSTNSEGIVTYEAAAQLKYMEQVIDETLRMYPAIPQMARQCTKDYKLPDSESVLEKGTRLVLPIYALHHDPKYYPHPEVFNPDRFSEENKTKIHPFTYLPFGGGPRMCIGLRFGLLETKVGLLSLLKNYRFSLNEKTPTPLKFNPKSVLMGLEENILLNAQRIE